MDLRLNGLNPLGYMGVNPSTPVPFINRPFDPTANDWQNFTIGSMWLNTKTEAVWMLVSLAGNSATWVMITGASGAVTTLTGNSGGAVSSLLGNINVVGDATTINIVGVPGTHTLTASTSGIVATSFPTDSGTATPSAGVLNIKAGFSTLNCGSSVEFTGATNIVTLNVTDSNSNTIIGKLSGASGISGTHNTMLGNACGSSLTTGGSNTFIGYQAGSAVTTGFQNTIIGDASLVTGLNGFTNIFGYYAIGAAGGGAGLPSTPFIHNYGGGNGGNTFVGYGAGSFNVGQVGSNLDNTAIGQSSLTALTTGTNNCALGYQAGFSITSGTNSVYIGRDAGLSVTTGSNNVIIGKGSGNLLSGSESNNLLIGHAGISGVSSLIALTLGGSVGTFLHNKGTGNAFLGISSGNFTLTTAQNNVGIGPMSLFSLTIGNNNVGLGNITGTLITTGSDNTMIGYSAGNTITTGSDNILIGNSAGTNYGGTESSNIIITTNALYPVAGDNNTIRIGAPGSSPDEQNRCFIAGIRGITTDAADAIAVLISSTGQLGTVSSSIKVKENIEDMGDASSNIMKLRPVTFVYKNESTKSLQYGFIAEEVKDLMPRLVVHDVDTDFSTVKYHELPQLLLNELIKLSKRVEELEKILVK